MIAQENMLPHYTYDDYIHWEGKWELINGIPFAMSPALLPKHQKIAASMAAVFFNAVKDCEPCSVYHPIDYKVAEDIVLQPDLLVVCNDIEKKFLDFTPALIVEILSSSTALKDRHTKYPIYEAQGVKYFIMISPEKEIVEIYEIKEGEYNLQFKGHDFVYDFSFDNCIVNINFSEIW